MKKYWRVYVNSIQDALADRARLVVYVLEDFIPPTISIMLWLGIYNFSGKVASGWELNKLISYYIVIAFLTLTLNHYIEFPIGFRDIKEGGLIKYLMRPLSYLMYIFSGSNGWKTVRFLFSLLPYSLLIIIFRQYLSLSPSLSSLTMAILFAAISYMIIFFQRFLLGITSFWITDNDGLVNFFWMIQALFSGLLIPLDFLPKWLQSITWFFPFRFFYYFPAKIIFEQLRPSSYSTDLFLAVLWMIGLGLLSSIFFKRGLKVFSDTRQ